MCDHGPVTLSPELQDPHLKNDGVGGIFSMQIYDPMTLVFNWLFSLIRQMLSLPSEDSLRNEGKWEMPLGRNLVGWNPRERGLEHSGLLSLENENVK